jgi:hypothetical protein
MNNFNYDIVLVEIIVYFVNENIVDYFDIKSTVANRPGMTGTIPEQASLSRVPAKK